MAVNTSLSSEPNSQEKKSEDKEEESLNDFENTTAETVDPSEKN